MEQLTIGTKVKMVYGMGRTEYGTVVDFITNRWNRNALVILEDGSEEYVSEVSENGIGCHIVK